jgi:hypothetical protein
MDGRCKVLMVLALGGGAISCTSTPAPTGAPPSSAGGTGGGRAAMGGAASGGSAGTGGSASGGAINVDGSGGAAGGGGSGGAGGGEAGGSGGQGDSGGSGGSAGDDAPQASGGDGGMTPGPAGPCKFALCESFEIYKDGDVPDPAVWAQRATKATVGSTFAARGSKALHIPAFTKDNVQIRETKTFPALEKAFYARVYLYVDKQPTEAPATLYHWTMIEASETETDGGHRVRLGGHIEKATGKDDWLRFNYETGLTTTPHETGLSDASSVIEPKKWHCIQIYFSMPDSEARIWLDEVERPKLHWKNNMPGMFSFPAAIKSLSFGWVEYQPPQTPWEVWLDEIAVDANPIGCKD